MIGLASAGAPVSDEEDERIIGWEYPTDSEYRPHMLCLEVDGESMNNGDADGMRHGDRLYVDPTDMQLQENKIYVVHLHGNGIVVKRARRLGTDWWLFSDNTDYKPTRPDEATVIGRVYYHQPRGKRL
ncbi:S24 family peptidase [Deinococcus sp. 14RED07]|uniref:S24 family peptidase n=1 Tax=Deinococcus sp. 14RED07 TaxID=2745874 RepID=UPI001E3AE082